MIWRRLTVLALIVVLLTAVGTLLFSTSGLRLLTTALMPEGAHFQGVSGRLIGPGKVYGIRWSSEKLDASVEQVAWGASPFSYYERGVRIESLHLSGVELELTEEFVFIGRAIQIDSVKTTLWIGQDGLGVEGLEVVDDLIVATGDFKMTQRPDPQISADLNWSIKATDGIRWSGHSAASGDLETLEISSELRMPAEAVLAGSLYDPTGDIPSYDLTLNILPLKDSFGIQQIEQFSANMHFRGTVTEVFGEGQLHVPALVDGPADLLIEAQSAKNRIDLDWTVSLPDSVGASGTTSIDLSDGSPRVSARVETESMPTALLHPEFSGEFSTDLSLQGRMKPEPAFAIELAALDGTLNGQPLSGSGNLAGSRESITISDLDLAVGANHLSADGQLGSIIDIDWQLDAPSIEDLLPGGSGSIEGRGSLTGEMLQPGGYARLSMENFTWADLTVETGELDARFNIAEDTIEVFQLRLGKLEWNDWVVDNIDGEVQGTPSNHTIALFAESGPVQAEIELRGALSGDEWSGRIEMIEVNEPVAGNWTLEAASAFRIGVDAQKFELACLRSDQARVCFSESKPRGEPAQFSANISKLPVALFSDWAIEGYEYGGEISANIDARLRGQEPPVGTVEIRLDRLVITDSLLDQAILNETSGTLLVASSNESVHAELDMELPAGDRLEGRAQTGHAPDDPLTGYLKGRVARLEFIPILFPQVAQVDGAMVIDAKLDGTRSSPKMVGALSVDNGSATLLDPGITVHDIQLDANADQDVLNLRGGATSGEGTVDLTGQLQWADPLVGELRITGSNFRIADLPPTFIDVSPDLTVRLNGRSISVRGDVLVDRATLAPIDIRMTANPSPDQILIGAPNQASVEPFDVDVDIAVRLSDQIVIDAYGLTGTLSGSLNIQQAPRQPALARGTLAVNDGYFSAYGTNLDIERGRLIYSGGSIDNPGMDVRAERYVESLMAGVEVRGTLQDPKIRLVSDPPMTRHNMLALLVSGQPPDNLGSASEQLGMSSVGTSSQGALLGFDVGGISISVNSGESGSSDKYIDYLNELTLRYRLSKKWSIEASRGVQDTGLDVIRIIR